jgi:hypothetical protein
MDNVWIGGNGANDSSHILKFTARTTAYLEVRFLMQLGEPGMRTGSNDTENFWRCRRDRDRRRANEAYVADGYGNKRVAVLDVQTGEMKRFWGAYGNVPDDAELHRTTRARRRRSSSGAPCTARSRRTTT